MKDDERRFLIWIKNNVGSPYTNPPLTGTSVRELINRPDFFMNYKRAWYVLGKWADKGWYEYGVSLDLGWLTDKGMDVI
jgi:hypothetical protein